MLIFTRSCIKNKLFEIIGEFREFKFQQNLLKMIKLLRIKYLLPHGLI